MTLVHADNAMDPSEVLQRIIKQHQLHLSLLFVVFHQDLLGNRHKRDSSFLLSRLQWSPDLVKQGLCCLVVLDILVHSGGLRGHEGAVVPKEQRVLEGHLGVVPEVCLHQLPHVVADQGVVLVVGQAIVEHTEALVSPHTDHTLRGVKAVGCDEEEAMVDAREIPEVEDVVELGGGRGEVANNAAVQLHGCLGDDLGQVLHVCRQRNLLYNHHLHRHIVYMYCTCELCVFSVCVCVYVCVCVCVHVGVCPHVNPAWTKHVHVVHYTHVTVSTKRDLGYLYLSLRDDGNVLYTKNMGPSWSYTALNILFQWEA